MVDLPELEVNVLEFLHKSFSFDRLATVDGQEYAVFHRRETETESKLRPKVIRLFVVAPREWVLYDATEDLLRIGPDGRTPGPRSKGEARAAAAEPTDFGEQGVDWHRETVPMGIAYLPRERAVRLKSASALGELGLA